MREYGISTTLTLQVSRSSPSSLLEKNILPCTAAHWINDKANISEWMFQRFWEASGRNSLWAVKERYLERGWSVWEAVVSGGCGGCHSLFKPTKWKGLHWLFKAGHNGQTTTPSSSCLNSCQWLFRSEHYTYTIYGHTAFYCLSVRFWSEPKGKNVREKRKTFFLFLFFFLQVETKAFPWQLT